MPYVNVPKDFSNVEAKVVFGLTKRQLIAAAAGLGTCLPIYFFLSPKIGDMALILIVMIATPIFMFGFYKSPDGRRPEKIFANYVRVRYQLPRIRPYMAENIYANIELANKIQEVINDANDNRENEEGKDKEDKKARSIFGFAKIGKKKDRPAD